MKRINIVIACMGVIAPAYGVQELTLRDQPPLDPLHWCKHPDGHVAAQRDPCESDTTEVSSVMERQPDGTMAHLPLEKQQATDAADTPAMSDSAPKQAQPSGLNKSPLGDFWRRMVKWLGFALAVGILAKLLKRSFVLWFILGFVLRAILVALNVMGF